MARDSKGMNLAKVEFPIYGRTIVGETTEKVTARKLKNTLWYPKGGTWQDLGLYSLEGGPQHINESVIRASGYKNNKTAILNGDVNVGLRLTVAEYAPIIFRLQSGKNSNTNLGALTKPQRQKKWLVFHEERYKSGRVRRIAGIATAIVTENQHVRGEALTFEIYFNFLPIVTEKDVNPQTGIGTPKSLGGDKTNDKGKKKPPGDLKVPGVDLVGSGLPGYNNVLDGGKTIEVPGQDGGDIKLLEVDTDTTPEAGPDWDQEAAEEPSVVTKYKDPVTGPFRWLPPTIISAPAQPRGTGSSIPETLPSKRVIFVPFAIENKKKVGALQLFFNTVAQNTTYSFALYQTLPNGTTAIGEKVRDLGSFTINTSEGNTTKTIEFPESIELGENLFWIGMKNCTDGITEAATAMGWRAGFQPYSPIGTLNFKQGTPVDEDDPARGPEYSGTTFVYTMDTDNLSTTLPALADIKIKYWANARYNTPFILLRNDENLESQ